MAGTGLWGGDKFLGRRRWKDNTREEAQVFWAVHRCDVRFLRRAVQRSPEKIPKLLRARDSRGQTALHQAAARGNRKMLGYVLELHREHGVGTAPWNAETLTPLHLAAKKGKNSAVLRLIDEKAFAADGPGLERGAELRDRRALFYCIANCGARVAARCISLCAEPLPAQILVWAAANPDPRVAELLIAAGAKVGAAVDFYSYEATPLHAAVLRDNCRVASLLLASGAPIERPGCFYTALHAAAWYGASRKTVGLLLRNRADVHARTEDNELTPLHLAVSGGREAGRQKPGRASRDRAGMVALLLEAGADVSAADPDGWTSLHSACASGAAPPIVALLLEAARNSFPWQVGGGSLALLGLQAEEGETALHLAATSSSPEVVKQLLDAGADASALLASQMDHEGRTPLHDVRGSARDAKAKIRLLLEAGAEIEARGGARGRTPLLHAIHCGQMRTALELIAAGADVRAREDRGDNTSLHLIAPAYARGEPHAGRVVGALIAAGADVHSRCRRGKTPLDRMALPGDAKKYRQNLEWEKAAEEKRFSEEGRAALPSADKHGYSASRAPKEEPLPRQNAARFLAREENARIERLAAGIERLADCVEKLAASRASS